jgi:hypothetical protein
LRRIRWTGHIALMGRGEVYTGFGGETRREKDHLQDPHVEMQNNIKMNLQELGWGA